MGIHAVRQLQQETQKVLAGLLDLPGLSAADRAQLDQLLASANDLSRYAATLDTRAGMVVFIDGMQSLLTQGKAVVARYKPDGWQL